MLQKLLPAVLVGAIAITIPVVADDSPQRPVRSLPANLDLSVFKQRATAEDQLSPAIARTGAPRLFQTVKVGERTAVASRLVGRFADFDHFAIPGKDGTVCLFSSPSAGSDGAVGGSCSPASQLKSSAIVSGTGLNGRQIALAGLIEDGYERAEIDGQSAPVVNNTFFLTVPRGRFTIRLEGFSVPSRKLTMTLGQAKRR